MQEELKSLKKMKGPKKEEQLKLIRKHLKKTVTFEFENESDKEKIQYDSDDLEVIKEKFRDNRRRA